MSLGRFATQDEYLSHGDVSRGQVRTIYNMFWNLIDNCNFPRTLIETMILQSRVQPPVMDMCHQTNSGKSATGPNTHACNFNFQHTHIENCFFHQDRSSVPGKVSKGPFQKCWSRSRGHVEFYWFSQTLMRATVLPPRKNTWTVAMCQGAIPEQSTTGLTTSLEISSLHIHL